MVNVNIQQPTTPSRVQPVIPPKHVRLENHSPCELAAVRPNIADRKRLKKQNNATRRELQWHAFQCQQMIEKEAHAGYERFHQLPLGSSTKNQIENTSCGIQGWATYAGTIDDTLTRWEHILPQERGTIQLSAYLPIPEQDNKHVDILTKATSSGRLVISTVSQAGWECIEITIDSGACDTVLPSAMLSPIATEQTDASRAGEEYDILNEGQKRCMMMTPGSATPKGIILQVSDVHKPLTSAGAMTDAGFECLLAKEGGFMRDIETGEMIPLTRRGNLYVPKAGVRSADSDFLRPS